MNFFRSLFGKTGIGIIVLAFVLVFSAGAQNDSIRFFDFSPQYSSKRLKSVIAVETVGYAATMLGLNELWYKNYPRSSFHLFNDNEEWLQMDKAGHAVTAYQVGRAGAGVMRWSGINEKKAIWIGGSLGFIVLTSIEILDAYSSEWGFSTGDLLANAMGSMAYIGQELGWKEQRILLKFSYSESKYAHFRPELLGSTFSESLLKDYNGQTYWLSANIASFINHNNKFPKWLNLAFGYGAGGMLGGSSNPLHNSKEIPLPSFERYRQYYLSLDVDLTRIKTSSRFLNTCLSTFGFIKFPAPAMEYNRVEGIKFLPFYF